tara:strand:+ start:1727 stop:3073 length:1347 start_codon:yes stop_codon:yes gene_type:complete
VAKVTKKCFFIIKILIITNYLTLSAYSLEIIRDTELETFTNEIISILLKKNELNQNEIKTYFIKSDQVNAFVTGGKNMFINTETIIEAEDYREYAAVLAHELAHIIGGHIFNTSIELTNMSNKALPVYLLGIIGIMAGATETGLAGVMVGQASISDGFAYYSRTQEASADQAAVKILCRNGIDGSYLINFLNKIESVEEKKFFDKKNYRSTHPLIKDRITWVNLALKNFNSCNYDEDKLLNKRFELLKAKLHGFTHSHLETESIYSSDSDIDLYATAVSSYFQGDHKRSQENLQILINSDPSNPFYKELIGEIFFVNGDYDRASFYHKMAIEELSFDNDLYFMMMGNYLISSNDTKKILEAVYYLKKSIQINEKNAYSWYLLARSYALLDNIPLANYATAERYFLIGERALSYEFAIKALKNVEEYTPEWYRSLDLIEVLKKEVLNKR